MTVDAFALWFFVAMMGIGMVWWQLTVGRFVKSGSHRDYLIADLGMRVMMTGLICLCLVLVFTLIRDHLL